MFWSKIWFFVVAAVAAVSLTLALLMPRPAERATTINDKKRLTRACGVAEILLRDSARNRIQLAGEYSRAAGLDDVLIASSKGDIVSGDAHSTAKTLLQSLKVRGSDSLARRLDVALLDRHGRVVARSGKKSNDYGDSLAGYFLVDDALDGYLRDDLWAEGGNLFMVAGSPVVTRQLDWAGAVVVRELIDKDFTDELAKLLDIDVSFYVGGEAIATSTPVQIHKDILAHFADMPAATDTSDCAATEPFTVSAADKSYWVQLARLPGEAGSLGAFFAVYTQQEAGIGFAGTIHAVKKDDLAFKTFPWLRVGGMFVVMVLIGMALMVLESDRPLRRLSNDAVVLAKGDSERLEEERHRGKFGSIARSVNIAIDKLHRETRSAKKDLDNLLGPAPSDTAPAALPAAGPLGSPPGPFVAPPPSEFKFSGGDVGIDIPPPPPAAPAAPPARPALPSEARIPPPPVALPPAKPPIPSAGKTPRPQVLTPPATPRPASTTTSVPIAMDGKEASGPLSLDDDILGRPAPAVGDDEETRVSGATPGADADDGYFRDVYDQFIALKKQCGESVETLTFEKFAKKLRSNRDALIAKHGCRTVRFQVYAKDGKAALKASPVRG